MDSIKTVSKHFSLNQNGQFSYVIYFVVVMIIFLPILLIGFPVLQNIAIGFLGASDDFVAVNNSLLPDIQDPALRADVNSMIQMQTDAQATRIDIMNSAIVFGAIFLVIIVFIGLYLLARRNVEVGSLG